MKCVHHIEDCDECSGLPEPRVIRLHIQGVVQHFYTFDMDTDIADLKLGDLKPYPALDAWKWLEGINSRPVGSDGDG